MSLGSLVARDPCICTQWNPSLTKRAFRESRGGSVSETSRLAKSDVCEVLNALSCFIKLKETVWQSIPNGTDWREASTTPFFVGCSHKTLTFDVLLFGRRIYELLKMFPRDLLSPQMNNKAPFLVVYKGRSSLALTS